MTLLLAGYFDCRVDAGRVTTLGLLREVWSTLRGRLLAALVLMSLQDAAIFTCQRIADLATNHGGLLSANEEITNSPLQLWPVACRTSSLDT